MRKRNLSEFMSIEMLYDYKSGKLDPLRREAVEEGLQSSPRVREELKKLSIGISYCEKLKNVSVSEPLVDLILHQPRPAQKVFLKFRWSNFPQPVRWAFEAIVVAVAIALFITQVPDLFKGEQQNSDSMLVKKFDIKPNKSVEKVPPADSLESSSDIQVSASPADVDSAEPPKDVSVVASTVIPELLRPLPPEEESAKQANVAANSAQQNVTEASSKPAKKGNAYIYRMTMYVGDVDIVTPQIVALIKGLGGHKAGEVELGWRRKSGSYFHFSIPLVNSPTLQEGLKKFAPFNIVKSAHPRVMPADLERYILWVERKDKPEEPKDIQEQPEGFDLKGVSPTPPGQQSTTATPSEGITPTTPTPSSSIEKENSLEVKPAVETDSNLNTPQESNEEN